MPGASGRDLLNWARRAEVIGLDLIAVTDRVVYDS
jgi:hypothetical protein